MYLVLVIIDECRLSFKCVLAYFNYLTADNKCQKFLKIWTLSQGHYTELFTKFQLNRLGLSGLLTTLRHT